MRRACLDSLPTCWHSSRRCCVPRGCFFPPTPTSPPSLGPASARSAVPLGAQPLLLHCPLALAFTFVGRNRGDLASTCQPNLANGVNTPFPSQTGHIGRRGTDTLAVRGLSDLLRSYHDSNIIYFAIVLVAHNRRPLHLQHVQHSTCATLNMCSTQHVQHSKRLLTKYLQAKRITCIDEERPNRP